MCRQNCFKNIFPKKIEEREKQEVTVRKQRMRKIKNNIIKLVEKEEEDVGVRERDRKRKEMLQNLNVEQEVNIELLNNNKMNVFLKMFCCNFDDKIAIVLFFFLEIMENFSEKGNYENESSNLFFLCW